MSECYDVVALLTTMTSSYHHISLHGVRCDRLERKAATLGLPLRTV